MAETQVTVVAHVRAQLGHEAAVKQALLNLVPITLGEEGCINFDLHEELGALAHFVFHENWASRALLERHLAAPHVQAFVNRAGPLLVEPPSIKVYRRVS